MIKFKKVIAMGLAAMAAVSAMSMTALAASNIKFDAVEVTEAEYNGISQIVSPWEHIVNTSLVLSESVFLPKNTNGENGEPCGEFTADASHAVFTITSATGGTETYNVQLYKGTIANGGTRVAKYDKISVGSGWSRSNLTVGATYFYKVSSDDCPDNGANADYTIDTY